MTFLWKPIWIKRFEENILLMFLTDPPKSRYVMPSAVTVLIDFHRNDTFKNKKFWNIFSSKAI